MSEEQKMSEQAEVRLFGNTKFGKWLDNFWYHYKFHTICVVVLLLIVTVCVVQCASRPANPDAYICYAGRKDLRPTSKNTAAQDMEAVLKGMATTALDTEDPQITLFHYLIITASDNPTTQNLSLSNIETLKAQLDVAGSYLYLLDESLYNVYTQTAGGAHYMTEVAPYLKEGSNVELTPDGRGVYLRSTALYSQPGFSSLPEDTVLCLRISFTISGAMNGKKQQAFYKDQEALFAHLINS